MDKTVELLLRSFTRYFIPGLVFCFASLILPLALLDHSFLASLLQRFELLIVGSLVAGYVLDSVGAYSWTCFHRQYQHDKADLARALVQITSVSDQDPDSHLARLWLTDEKTYDRIFSERAEWVLILESSFALLIGAVLSLCIAVGSTFTGKGSIVAELGLSVVLFFFSYRSAGKGLQRMRAHNAKLLSAMSRLYAGVTARGVRVDQSSFSWFPLILALKNRQRKGWLTRGLDGDSIADHSYGTILIGWVLAELEHVERHRVLEMLVVHELDMAKMNDVTPVSSDYSTKLALEWKAAEDVAALVDEPGKTRYLELMTEYLEGRSPEAKLAKEAAKLETLLQAEFYELHNGRADILDEFLSTYSGVFQSRSATSIFGEVVARHQLRKREKT